MIILAKIRLETREQAEFQILLIDGLLRAGASLWLAAKAAGQGSAADQLHPINELLDARLAFMRLRDALPAAGDNQA